MTEKDEVAHFTGDRISEVVMRPAPIVALLVAVIGASGRSQSVETITVRGSVVDAATAAPLSGALITLVASGPRAVLPPQGASPQLTETRSATSDTAGAYQLLNIPSGRYELNIRRLGYQPAVIDLDLTAASGTSRLSVGLVVVPIQLRALNIESTPGNSFGRLEPLETDNSTVTVGAARARASEFLGTDVRELTAPGSLAAGGTGEIDVFRAMRRLPGVTGYDDRSAELWIRGTRWDQVRVSYDGVPIFNPFHASGTLTGVGGDAIGAAFLHPGVRPVSLLNQGASLIDIRSRAATDTVLQVSGEASWRGVSASMTKASPKGKGGITFSVRHSFDDLTIANVPRWHELKGGGFTEFSERTDHNFGESTSISFSALQSKDYWPAIPTKPNAHSGTFLNRIGVTTGVGRYRVSFTGGLSWYHTTDYWYRPPGAGPLVVDPQTYSEKFADVNYAGLRAELRPRAADDRGSWALGYDFSNYSTRVLAPKRTVYWSDLSSLFVSAYDGFKQASLWGERRWNFDRRLSVDAGLRLEGGTGAPRIAGSLQARHRLDAATSLSAGVSRNFQDLQQLSGSYPSLYPTDGFWIVTGGGLGGSPPLRADQANIGLERWIGTSTMMDLNIFGRRITNLAMSPLPNGDTLSRPLFDLAQVNARGFEVSARHLVGRLTGSLGYTYTKATEQIDGVTYLASGDRTHAIDATALVRAGRFRFGPAFTYMTGAPYTQILTGRADVNPGGTTSHWTALSTNEGRNAQRLPDFASADLFAEWTGSIKRLAIAPYLGIQNFTGRDNLTFPLPREIGMGPSNNQNEVGFYAASVSGRSVNLGFRIAF